MDRDRDRAIGQARELAVEIIDLANEISDRDYSCPVSVEYSAGSDGESGHVGPDGPIDFVATITVRLSIPGKGGAA